MMRKIIIIFILMAIALVGWWVVGDKNKLPRESSQISPTPSIPSVNQTYEAKRDEQGEVTLGVMPEKLGVNEEENVFSLKFDTHSVDLDFDFEKIMVLEDNLGNNYQPLRWEGEQGGHHLTGRIVFPKINSQAQKAVLKISQIGGVERTFNWNL